MNNSANPKVAYILKGYPRISETFILNEIRLLEGMGQSLRIFSVKREKEKKKHTIVGQIQAEVSYSPEDTSVMESAFWKWLQANLPRYGSSHLKLWMGRPLTYWRTFFYVLFGLSMQFSYRRWPRFKRSFIKDFFRAGYVAQQILDDDEIAHLHGHFCHGSTTITMLASYLTGIPFSFTAHAKDIYVPKLNPNGLLQTKIQEAEFVATCTDANRQYLEQLWPGDTSIHTIYHGLDTQLFSPTHTVTNGLPSQENERPLQILSVGRFVAKKGYPFLIKACCLLRERGVNFRCLLVGQPDEHTDLIVEMIQEANLTEYIQMHPGMTQDELRQTYEESDIFTLACHIVENGDRDGIPNVLAEAMAMELPVVSTSISGIPELVSSEVNGLLVQQKDAEALADALARLLTDETLRRQLGRAARATILEIFDSKQTTVTLHQLFQELIAKRIAPDIPESTWQEEAVSSSSFVRAGR